MHELLIEALKAIMPTAIKTAGDRFRKCPRCKELELENITLRAELNDRNEQIRELEKVRNFRPMKSGDLARR